jgi:hypothetical protein
VAFTRARIEVTSNSCADHGGCAGSPEVGPSRDAEFQNTAMFGGAFSFVTFSYHLGSSIGWMGAPAGSPGELGHTHDYGGVYFTLEGTIDG